jgi:hypothetical protein
MLNDIWVTWLILRFVSWFEFAFAGHEAISSGQAKRGWRGYWVSAAIRPMHRHRPRFFM